MLVFLTIVVGVTALATIVAGLVLWPADGDREQILADAREIGLASDRLAGEIVEATEGTCTYAGDDSSILCRRLTVKILEGPEAGALTILPEYNLNDPRNPQVNLGDQIVLGYEPQTNFYFFADLDREGSLIWLFALFAVVVLAFGRLRGALALLSMALTVIVLVTFVAPTVLDGHDPLLVSVVAASAIAISGLYLTHGVNPTTTVALAGTLGALALTLALAAAFFSAAQFTGLASEEALTLPLLSSEIKMSSLILGGAVLGALGALDDVTVTQVATIAELRQQNPLLSRRELIAAGIRVGREHIASTVNTLLLAYAGASLPLILLFEVSQQSLATVANSELVAVEIARTLCGSIGLVAAVPLTTSLAAIVVRPPEPPTPKPTEHQQPPTAPPPAEPESAAPPAPETPGRKASWDEFSPDTDRDLW